MKRRNKLFGILVAGLFLCLPVVSFALSGTNADGVRVKIYTKQGGDWFRVSTIHADDKGVLELKNAIPGWYKMVIDDNDEKSNQTLGAKIRMRDEDGKRIKEKTNVDAYIEINDKKLFIATYETDKKGWIKMSSLSSGLKYYLDVKGKSSLSKKDGRPRIKVKAKIDDSNWFQTLYQRTDESKVLEVEHVLPGKYKFSYKNGDRSSAEPFTLKIRMVDEKGRKIKKATKFDLYAYVNKVKIPMGTLRTDHRGWLTVPGTMTEMKYKIDIND